MVAAPWRMEAIELDLVATAIDTVIDLIAVAVFAQHTCHGATGAAPIARDIILAYFQKHHPEIIKADRKSVV